MKRLAIALVVITALIVPAVGAQGPDTLPGQGWWTGQQIMNIGTGPATIVSTAYDSVSSNVYMAQTSSPIAPFASVTFLPGDFVNMPQGFQGSAVVSSNEPIKAMVTLTNRQVGSLGTPGGLAGASYQAIDGSAAATTVQFPIVKRNYSNKTTTFFVQNAGSANATVTANYACADGAHTYTSPSMGPGQMVVLNPAAATPPVASGSLCAATVTSLQLIAGVSVEHFDAETVATLAQSTRGFTTADYSHTAYAPLYKKLYPCSANPCPIPSQSAKARSTGAQVQNVDTTSFTITATYYYAGGSCPSGSLTQTSPSVAPGSFYTFLEPAGMPDNCLASAKFTASGNIVGIVNEAFLHPQPAAGTQSATAYNMMPDSSATAKLVAPLFKEKVWGGSTSAPGKTSGLQVQNIGASSATIYAVFQVGATTYTTVNYSVASGASKNFYLMSDCGAGCWTGTAIPANVVTSVTVFSNQPILGYVSEQTWTTPIPNCFGQSQIVCYDRLNYEAFNVTP